MNIKISPYMNIIQKQLQDTARMNKKNYGNKADQVMKDMEHQDEIHDAFSKKPNKHVQALTSLLKNLDNL